MVIATNSSMFGFMLGTIITNKTLALEIAPLFFLPFLLFSGFTTNSGQLISDVPGLDQVDRVPESHPLRVRVLHQDGVRAARHQP